MPQALHPQRISPFSTVIIFTVLTAIGVFITPLLAVKLMPEHDLNSLVVHCNLPGSSPEATELQVTSHLEDAVAGLNGVKSIRSISGAGTATVYITLDKWTDPAVFRLEASSLLRQLYPQLPLGASYPNITVNRSGIDNAYEGFLVYELHGASDAQTLTQYAQEQLQPLLAGIRHIKQISIAGAPPQYWELTCSDTLMQQIHINTNDIIKVLHSLLTRGDAGITIQSTRQLHLIKNDNTQDPVQILDLPVKRVNNRLIRLGDIARLQLAEAPPSSYQRINGRPVVTLSISADPQANTLLLKKQISQAMQLQLPPGYYLQLAYDSTEYLEAELSSLYIRTGLSVAILLLFVWLVTRKLTHLLVVVVSMIVNIFLSFIGYYICRLDIHLYSLAGITISLGLTIDNSIIIIEDLEQQKKGRVFFAILASTLTSVIALSVIFFLDERQQLNLVDFAIAILINLIVSLPVVFFFTPALYQLMHVSLRQQSQHSRHIGRLSIRLQRGYDIVILWLLRHRKKMIIGFILLFGLPVFLIPDEIPTRGKWSHWYNNIAESRAYRQIRPICDKLLGGTLRLFVNTVAYKHPPVEHSNERPSLRVEVLMPPGATLTQIDEIALEFEQYLSQFHEIALFKTVVSDAQNAGITIFYKPGILRHFPGQLKQRLEDKAMTSGAADFKIYGVGDAFDNTVGNTQMESSFVVKGYNYAQLYHFATRLKQVLQRIPRVDDIFLSPFTAVNQSSTYAYHLRIYDKQLMQLLQTTAGNLAGSLNSRNERSVPVNDMLYEDTYLPLKVHSHASGAIALWELMQAPTPLSDSQHIRISNLATVEKEKTNQAVVKENHAFVLNILYKFTGTFEQNKLMQKDIIKSIRKDLPYGYHIDTGSNYYSSSDSGYYRYILLIAAFILAIYLVCAILLESLLLPLAVILMIPVSFIGVFLTFYYLDIAFGDGGYASLLMLCGIVTNGALYVVNDMQHLKKQRPGLDRRRTFLKAFMHKGVPIFITTLSAVLSMLPFMLNGSEQGFWYTLSVGTTGGLLFSFIGTCLLLPLCLRLNKAV